MSLTKVTYSMIEGAQFNVLDYGADNTGVADSAAAIQSAISAAAAVVGGSIGAVVYFPTGTYAIGTRLVLPNRVGLQGANGRGTTIKPHSSFADSYMFHAFNGTSSMFGSWMRDIYINATGKNMTALVWSQAWQESCGMERVTMLIDGTTLYGLLCTDGYGGASYLRCSDCEIFHLGTAVGRAGVQVNQISLTGGFIFHWDGGSITGGVASQLSAGIRMDNDTLCADVYHCEYVDTMVEMKGVGGLSANTLTGSFNNIVDIITLTSTFTGSVSLRNIIPNGATGNIVTDATPTALNIATTNVSILPSYDRLFSGFSAYVSAQIPNVTGNGTEYTIPFNTEIYDYQNEYVTSTGVFTAKRAGKYLFEAAVKITASIGNLIYVMRVNTSNRDYILFRGNTDSLRDSGNSFTITGSAIADMDVGDVARVTVLMTGLGADTADIEPDETKFQGQWLTR